MSSNKNLLDHLRRQGVLNRPGLEEAFARIDRARFVPAELGRYAYEDRPLPLGEGQTISQPYTVAFMLDLLDVRPGMAILDIGAGSGWTTALLCDLTGPGGQVTGLERIPELAVYGRANLAGFSLGNGRIERAGSDLGLPGERFDRILVSASAPAFPRALTKQLKPGGILVLPVGREIRKVTKPPDGNPEELTVERHPGFVFVPLVY